MTEVSKVFAGKTLKIILEGTRGSDDAEAQKAAFLSIYSKFHELLMSLPDEDKTEFLDGITVKCD